MPSRRTVTSAAVAFALCAFQVSAAGEIQLTPAGEFRGMDGRPAEVPSWKIDATIAARIVAKHAGRQNRFVIDYEHQTLMAEDNGQPAPAAGWWTGFEWREGKGLFATGVEWTERAKAMIEAKEYAYLSPVFAYNAKTGEVIDIFNAALTNTPNLDGLAEVAQRAAARYSLQGDPTMDRTLLAALIAALCLPAETKEADALAGVAALKVKADKTADLETQLAAAKQQQTVDPGKFVSIETHNKMVERVTALTARLESQDLADAIDVAMSDGRLPAAEEAWARQYAKDYGIAALKASLEKRPVVQALLGQQTRGRQQELDKNKQGELTGEQLAVCKQLGIKPEDYKAQLAANAA